MRYSVMCCVAALIIMLLWYYGFSDRNIVTVTVVTDSRLNYATRKSIEEFIKNVKLKSGAVYWRTNFEYLKQAFLCIKDAKSVRKKRTHMYIKCAAHTPVVALNTSNIVTLDGLLIGVQFFRSDIIVALPQIVAETEIIPSELCLLARWALTIPELIRSQATILWKNPTEIHLLFKEYPKNPVLITTETELLPETIAALKSVIKLPDVERLDARFEGMLIARMEKKIKGKRRAS
ncbi:MAG: hypothetical protein K2X90_03000 [Candidatus Babeliaceae bacterium]|nr:hypothetical protein [Candidatus Babeliaceae bacterium]